jgi:hypothetical protein
MHNIDIKGALLAFIFLLSGSTIFSAASTECAAGGLVFMDSAQVQFELNLITKGKVVLPKHFDDTLKKVNLLLNRIYSSREFKDSLYAHSFNDSTFSKVKSACFAKEINENTHRIEGSNVYINLTAEKVIKLDLVVQETLNKTKTQGFSNACVYKITSNDYWMGEDQPLAYRYVRHIAHEFTHIRGYRHDNKVAKAYKWGRDPNEDPAYGVGRIVGNILERWMKAGMLEI